MEKEREIELGDMCSVINSNHLYSNLYEFSNEAGHPDIEENKYVTLRNDTIIKDKKVRVLFLGRTNSKYNRDAIVAIVETVNNPEYLKFMINTKGLEVLESFIEEYLSGGTLKETVPNKYVTDSLIEAIILKNPMDSQFICSKLLTDEHYKKILRKDGGLLGLLPIYRRTLELCKIAIEEEPYAEKFIPNKLRSLVN